MITMAVEFSAGTNHADRAHPIDPAFEEDDEQCWHWDHMADAFIVVRVLELGKVDFFFRPIIMLGRGFEIGCTSDQ